MITKGSESVNHSKTEKTMGKRQKDKQRSTPKTKDWATRTPLKPGGKFRTTKGSI